MDDSGKECGQRRFTAYTDVLTFHSYLFSGVKEDFAIYVFGISDDLCSLRRFSFMRKSIFIKFMK